MGLIYFILYNIRPKFVYASLGVADFFAVLLCIYLYEQPHDKTNKMNVRPAKTQISLGIRSV